MTRLSWGHDGELIAFVETDGPGCVGSGANEQTTVGKTTEMRRQSFAEVGALVRRQDRGVRDEGDVVDVVDAHDAEKLFLRLVDSPRRIDLAAVI